MTRNEAISLAHQLSLRFGVTSYVHSDAALGYNIRFNIPIERTEEEGVTTDIITRSGQLVPRDAWGNFQFLNSNGNISRRVLA